MLKAFKVLLLLVCLFQVALFKNGADDKGGDDHGGNNNANRCKIEYDPGHHEVRLQKGKNTLARGNFGLTGLEFEGKCNCNLILWNMANYKGKMLTYPFSKSNSHHIYVNRIWSRKAKSFEVVCKF